jgi:hypothetical protein
MANGEWRIESGLSCLFATRCSLTRKKEPRRSGAQNCDGFYLPLELEPELGADVCGRLEGDDCGTCPVVWPGVC